jgi:hypothetical protein
MNAVIVRLIERGDIGGKVRGETPYNVWGEMFLLQRNATSVVCRSPAPFGMGGAEAMESLNSTN